MSTSKQETNFNLFSPKFLIISSFDDINRCSDEKIGYYIILKEKFTLKDLENEYIKAIGSKFFENCAQIIVYMFLHGSFDRLTEENPLFVVDESINIIDFKNIFIKYFSFCPVYIIAFLCKSIFIHLLIPELYPGSKIITLCNWDSRLKLLTIRPDPLDPYNLYLDKPVHYIGTQMLRNRMYSLNNITILISEKKSNRQLKFNHVNWCKKDVNKNYYYFHLFLAGKITTPQTLTFFNTYYSKLSLLSLAKNLELLQKAKQDLQAIFEETISTINCERNPHQQKELLFNLYDYICYFIGKNSNDLVYFDHSYRCALDKDYIPLYEEMESSLPPLLFPINPDENPDDLQFLYDFFSPEQALALEVTNPPEYSVCNTKLHGKDDNEHKKKKRAGINPENLTATRIRKKEYRKAQKKKAKDVKKTSSKTVINEEENKKQIESKKSLPEITFHNDENSNSNE